MVVNPDGPHPVTKEHALWFGVIITEFARFELRMHLAAAGILNQDIGTAMILLGGMNFRQKVQTVWHLNRTIGADGKPSPEIAESLIEARKLSKLRNYIAHSTWTDGRKNGAIKPMFVGTHGDKLKVMGHDHNEPQTDVVLVCEGERKPIKCIEHHARLRFHVIISNEEAARRRLNWVWVSSSFAASPI